MAEQDGRWFEVQSSRFFDRRIALFLHISRVTRHGLAGCGGNSVYTQNADGVFRGR